MRDFTFIEHEVAENRPMPEGLDITDQAAFQALSHLHARFKAEKITKEQASAEKKAIKSAWEKRKSLDEFDRKLTQHHAAQTLRIENRVRAFYKAETADAAIKTAREIISIMDGIPAEIPRAWLEEMGKDDKTDTF